MDEVGKGAVVGSGWRGVGARKNPSRVGWGFAEEERQRSGSALEAAEGDQTGQAQADEDVGGGLGNRGNFCK